MASIPSRTRVPAVGMAAVMLATSMVWGGSHSAPVMAATPFPSAGPSTAHLSLPADGDLAADATLSVSETPEPLTPVSMDDVLERAYGGADTLALADWDVTALGGSLGTDPRAAFQVVRDAIRFDPYRGVLRGSAGALAARGGNASDRALLLHDLLAAMGIPSRFAFGDVAPEVAARLVDHAFDGPIAPLPTAGSLSLSTLDGIAIERRARRDYARLRDVLGDRMDAMAPVSTQAALMDVTHHTWIQVEEAGTWIDYDPSLPDAEPGQALTVAASTADGIPAADNQGVTIRVISETLHSDGVWEEVLLERRLDAPEAAEAATFLYFQPDTGGSGIGLFDSVGAATSYVPVLLIDTEAQMGAPFPIGRGGGGGGGGFGDFGGLLGGDDEATLLSLRLSITRDAPADQPREATHVLVDRVPAAARAAGSVDPATLPELPAGPGGPLPLGMIHQVLVSTGGADPRLHAIEQGLAASFAVEELLADDGPPEYALGDLLLPVAVANEALVVASERAIVPAVDAVPGLRSFVGRPRIFLASLGPGADGADSVVLQTDLLVDGVQTIARPGVDAAAAPVSQLWYGVLQGSLETEFGRALARTFLPEGRRSVGVSQAMDLPLGVIGMSEYGTLTTASPALVRAVAAGQLAIVPGDANTAPAWWTVDASTGATRAVIAPGLGGQFNSGYGTKPITSNPGKVWEIPDYKKAPRAPTPGGCKRGTEYLVIIGCVSMPVYWAIVSTFLVVVLSAVCFGILFAFITVLRARGVDVITGAAPSRIGAGKGRGPRSRDRLLETSPA